jgi:hypothetical protein
MPGNHSDIEQRLWDAADELRANAKLKASEYSVPVLGLIFLRYADHKFTETEKELAGKATGRRKVGKTDFQARGVLYLPDPARFSTLLQLTERDNLGKAINDAMKAIEEENEELRGILPKTYTALENATLIELLKLMASIPMDIEGDAFGKIYEYFLGEFAMTEGQKGGEFFTPTSIVRLIVEVIEPFHGRIYDPACGSGGMFVQSARFVENHKKNPSAEIMVYGQEKTTETVRLCKMNLVVHGLSGDIREANATLLRRNLLPPESVAVSCIGWQMGKAIMTSRPSFSNQQLNTIIPREGVVPDFLYYSLLPWREYLLSLGSAAGVRTPILNKSAFSDLRVLMPPLPIQRRIAAILSAYDDLIENNTRRIAILEEMARALYREWFVHFRFPGHEKVKMVKSALGPIPTGWKVAALLNSPKSSAAARPRPTSKNTGTAPSPSSLPAMLPNASTCKTPTSMSLNWVSRNAIASSMLPKPSSLLLGAPWAR